jgi:hypothetical protein
MKRSNIVLWSALAVFLAVLLAFLLILGFTTKRLLRDHERAAFSGPSRPPLEIVS